MAGSEKVVITSANCFTAGLLIPRLKAKGYHTIGLIRKPGVLECDETIPDWMNSAAARRALTEADHIIHLSGEINSKKEAVYIESTVTTTKIVTDAARKGNARRIIFLSYPGADAGHKNLYLRYKGKAEDMLINLNRGAFIFRCPIIIDSPDKPSRIDTLFISQNGKAVPLIGNGHQKMHPVYRGDVVDTIIGALERGSPGIYELSGSEEMTTNQFIRLVNQDPAVKISHTSAWLARLLGYFVKGLSPTFVDILLDHTNSRYDVKTYHEFGTSATSLTELWSKPRLPESMKPFPIR